MTTAELLDRVQNKQKWFNQKVDASGEVWFSIKDEILIRRLNEVGDSRDLKDLKPRERNKLEDDCWKILEKSFS
jgi:hypothetical protein